MITKEEVQTISVCQMILNTRSILVEYKDMATYMEWNIDLILNVLNHNVPCAVCHITTRVTLLMIPAKVNCPTNWTTEYTGYLMTERHNHHRSTYECVDKNPESVAGFTGGDNTNALLYHVEPQCNGFSCPPYSSQKELTCVVCSH